jgi:hypothetical protein
MRCTTAESTAWNGGYAFACISAEGDTGSEDE